jgi:hypothetical protein
VEYRWISRNIVISMFTANQGTVRDNVDYQCILQKHWIPYANAYFLARVGFCKRLSQKTAVRQVCDNFRALAGPGFLGCTHVFPDNVPMCSKARSSQRHPQTEEVATRSQIAVSDPRAARNVSGSYADFGRHGFGSICGWGNSPYVPTMSPQVNKESVCRCYWCEI